jgi:hypothetical protein
LIDPTKRILKAGLALDTTYALSRDRAACTSVSDNPTFPAQLERYIDGPRKAGALE